MQDPALLRRLFAWYPLCVLVTADDAMPEELGAVIRDVHATVATVASIRAPDYSEEEWQRDVVHRWAHAIQDQAVGSVRRYSLMHSSVWRPRRRAARRARV